MRKSVFFLSILLTCSFAISAVKLTMIDTTTYRVEYVGNGCDTMVYPGFYLPAWESTYGVGDAYPAYNINWYDAVLYCNARTKSAGKTDTVYSYSGIIGTPGNGSFLNSIVIDLSKNGFRLPTEAEWEYACRGNIANDYYWQKDFNPYPVNTADSNEISNYAIWAANSKKFGSENRNYGANPVAQKLPNAYKLYDMSGNVFEWCNDRYSDIYYGSSPLLDPTGPAGGSSRVIRGGTWESSASSLRSNFRNGVSPSDVYYYFGFRTCIVAAE